MSRCVERRSPSPWSATLPSYFISCPRGLEEPLGAELASLGVPAPRVARGGVELTGDLRDAYRVCLGSRIASRVLFPIARFPAPTPEALYQGARGIRWSDHLGPDQTLAVHFNSSASAITHTQFGAQKVKDAVVDVFREATGRRPSVDLRDPDVAIDVHLHRDEAVVSIDLSGEGLHRRGYRREPTSAPLKENLAAGILHLAGWNTRPEGTPFLDPMCGSGTLVIEAALMALGVPPGLSRTSFGFMRWRGHEAETWAALVEEARALPRRRLERALLGTDQDASAVRAARVNARAAGVGEVVELRVGAVAEAQPPGPGGLMVVNPPYGERLGDELQLRGLYAQLGQVLRERFGGWEAWMLAGNLEVARSIGLKETRRVPLFNGPIECRLLRFPILKAEERPPPRPRPVAQPLRAEAFANRLTKNLKHLRKWAQREGITCFRVYDRDIPEYAVAVDLYETWVHVQEFAPPATVDARKAADRLRDLMAAVPEVMGVPSERVFLKTRQRQKGGTQYEKVAAQRVRHPVHEGPGTFLVNFTDYLDTGLFLDHRLTRQRIGAMAKGLRFLNLYCYTATATVYAALGGARSSVSVDLSNTYLDWAAENFALNRLGADHRRVRGDCIPWLAEQRPGSFDLVFVDPPTFSRSKSMEGDLDIQRDHTELLRACLRVLSPRGSLLFSNNFQRFKFDTSGLPDVDVQDISLQTIPEDFKRHPKVHRAWILRRR